MREHSGVAGAIAGASFVFFVALPALLAISFIAFLLVYAIVKVFGVGGEGPSAGTVILGALGAQALLSTLLAAGAGWLGRSMSPRKRRRASAQS